MALVWTCACLASEDEDQQPGPSNIGAKQSEAGRENVSSKEETCNLDVPDVWDNTFGNFATLEGAFTDPNRECMELTPAIKAPDIRIFYPKCRKITSNHEVLLQLAELPGLLTGFQGKGSMRKLFTHTYRLSRWSIEMRYILKKCHRKLPELLLLKITGTMVSATALAETLLVEIPLHIMDHSTGDSWYKSHDEVRRILNELSDSSEANGRKRRNGRPANVFGRTLGNVKGSFKIQKYFCLPNEYQIIYDTKKNSLESGGEEYFSLPTVDANGGFHFSESLLEKLVDSVVSNCEGANSSFWKISKSNEGCHYKDEFDILSENQIKALTLISIDKKNLSFRQKRSKSAYEFIRLLNGIEDMEEVDALAVSKPELSKKKKRPLPLPREETASSSGSQLWSAPEPSDTKVRKTLNEVILELRARQEGKKKD